MFYTYMWLREDGTPYYVGKGSGDRAWKRRRVGNPPPERVVVTHWPSEEEAFVEEMRLIDYYGRVDLGTGCLRNLTNGGENPPNHKGKKHGPEWGAKRSAALKGRKGKPHSAETRMQKSLAMKGRTFSDETRKKMSEAQRGHRHSEETKRKLSMINKGVRKGVPWSKAIREAHEKRRDARKLEAPRISKFLTSIGLRIEEIRIPTGLTRNQLAIKAGVHNSQIWAIETGSVNVSIANLNKIAKALAVTLSELLHGLG